MASLVDGLIEFLTGQRPARRATPRLTAMEQQRERIEDVRVRVDRILDAEKRLIRLERERGPE